ncbi:hypothetical protein NMG60_11026629 [Bertholletia excelsa]
MDNRTEETKDIKKEQCSDKGISPASTGEQTMTFSQEDETEAKICNVKVSMASKDDETAKKNSTTEGSATINQPSSSAGEQRVDESLQVDERDNTRTEKEVSLCSQKKKIEYCINFPPILDHVEDISDATSLTDEREGKVMEDEAKPSGSLKTDNIAGPSEEETSQKERNSEVENSSVTDMSEEDTESSEKVGSKVKFIAEEYTLPEPEAEPAETSNLIVDVDMDIPRERKHEAEMIESGGKNETSDTFLKTEDQREILEISGKDSQETLPLSRDSSHVHAQTENEKLYKPPEKNKDKHISEPEVEDSKEIDTTEAANCSNVGKLYTVENEKSSEINLGKDKSKYEMVNSETIKGVEAPDRCIDNKNAPEEQGVFAKNCGSSLDESSEIEKAPVHFEASEVNSRDTLLEKNIETAGQDKELFSASESLAEEKTNKRFHESNQTNTEEEGHYSESQTTESRNEQINEENTDERETNNMELEPSLEIRKDISNSQDTILTEEVKVLELTSSKILEETHASSDTEMAKSEVAGDLNQESKASPMTGAMEEESNQAIETPMEVPKPEITESGEGDAKSMTEENASEEENTIGKNTTEENPMSDLSSSSLGKQKVEKSLKEEKRDQIRIEKEATAGTETTQTSTALGESATIDLTSSFVGEEKVEESLEEDVDKIRSEKETSTRKETTQTSTVLEEIARIDVTSPFIGDKDVEQSLKEDNDTIRSEKEARDLNLESIEQDFTTKSSTEERETNALKDEAETNYELNSESSLGLSEEEKTQNQSNLDTTEGSLSVPQIHEKVIKDSGEDSEVTLVAEDASLNKSEAEHKIWAGSSTQVCEERDIAATETSEVKANPVEASNITETIDMDMSTARIHEAEELEEKIDLERTNENTETLSTTEDQKERSTAEKSIDVLSEKIFQVSSTLSMEDQNLVTPEVSEKTFEAPEGDENFDRKAETHIIPEATKEDIMEAANETTDSNPDTQMRSIAIEKKSTHHNAQDEENIETDEAVVESDAEPCIDETVDKASEEYEIAGTRTIVEESPTIDLSSASVGEDKIEEILKEDKSDATTTEKETSAGIETAQTRTGPEESPPIDLTSFVGEEKVEEESLKEDEETESERNETDLKSMTTDENCITNSPSSSTREEKDEESLEESKTDAMRSEKEASEEYEIAGTRMMVEESPTIDLSSASVGEDKIEEILKEDKSDATTTEKEARNLNTECIEQDFITASSVEERGAKALKDEAERNYGLSLETCIGSSEKEKVKNKSNSDTTEDSFSVPQMHKKEIKDLEEDSETAVIADDANFKTSDQFLEERDLIATETTKTGSNSTEIKAKPAETSNLAETKGRDIPTARNYEAEDMEEKIDAEQNNEISGTLSTSGAQRESATAEEYADDISEQVFLAPSTVSMEEQTLVTAEASEATIEASERGETSYEKAETPLISEITREDVTEVKDESTNSINIEKKSKHHDGQDKDPQLHRPSDMNEEKGLSELDSVVLKMVNTSELANCPESGKLETSSDENSSSMFVEAYAGCTDIEEAIPELEDSAIISEGSSKEIVETENAVLGFEAEASVHGAEMPEAQMVETLAENTSVTEESYNHENQTIESTKGKMNEQDIEGGKNKMDEEMQIKLELEKEINKTQDAIVALLDFASAKSLQETASSNATEVVETKVAADLNQESEATHVTRALEGNTTRETERTAEVLSLSPEVFEEKTKEENAEAKSLKMSRTTSSSQQDAEVDTTEPEQTASIVSDLPTNNHEKLDNENVDVEKSEKYGEEIEETKIPDAVAECKYEDVKESQETDTSLTLEETDISGTEKQITEVPPVLSEPTNQGFKATADDEIVAIAEPGVEVKDIQITDAVPKSRDLGVNDICPTTASPTMEESTKGTEEQINEVPEALTELRNQGVIDAKGDGITPPQIVQAEKVEEQLQVPCSTLLSKEQDSETTTTIEKTGDESTYKEVNDPEENSNMVCKLPTAEKQLQVPSAALLSREQESEITTTINKLGGDESTNKEVDNLRCDVVCQLPISENQNANNAMVEKPDIDEVEITETKTLNAPSATKDQGFEEIHENKASPITENTGTYEIEEEIKGAEEISDHRYEGADAAAYEETPNKLAEQLQVSSSTFLSSNQVCESGTTIESIEGNSTKKDETEDIKPKESVGQLSKLPTVEQDYADNKTLSKEESKSGEVVIQQIKSSEAISESKAQDDDETMATVPDLTVGKTHLDLSEEESKATFPIKLTPQGSEDPHRIDSGNLSNEVDDLNPNYPKVEELLQGEVSEKFKETDLEFEKDFEYVYQTQSPEEPLIPKEKESTQGEIEGAKNVQSSAKNYGEETAQTNEELKKDTLQGKDTNTENTKQIKEKEEVASKSHLVSPSEEIITKNRQADELTLEDYAGERKEIKYDAVKNEIQHEMISEESGVEKNASEASTDEDRYGDRTTCGSLLKDTKDRKTFEETPEELEVKNQGTEANFKDSATETIAPVKEVSEVQLARYDNKGTDDSDKEFVMIKDEQLQNADLHLDAPPVMDASAEKAADEQVDEISEEVSEAHSKDLPHDVETYEKDQESSHDGVNDTERLAVNEKLVHTSSESISEGSIVKEDLYLNKQIISLCPEASQEKRAEAKSEGTDQGEHDIVSDKQIAEAVNILGGKSIQLDEEHGKDEEAVGLSTVGSKKPLRAMIHSTTTAKEVKGTPDHYEEPNVLPNLKDSETEVAHAKDMEDVDKVNEDSKKTKQLEETSLAMSAEQIASKPHPSESTKTINPREAKEAQCGEKKIISDESEETKEKPKMTELEKISLSDTLQRSTEPTSQVFDQLSEERELTDKEEKQMETAETVQLEEAKTDEEKEGDEGDEHKRAESGSAAPVMVEASRDVDVKVAHKKSHNILSGVGSKVKHSLAKVKKVITGKSSHPKSSSPK